MPVKGRFWASEQQYGIDNATQERVLEQSAPGRCSPVTG